MAPADKWERARPDDLLWDIQLRGVANPHVDPVNELVRLLGAEKGVKMPFAASWQGGIHAPALVLLNDSGPPREKTTFMCIRNPDRQRHLMSESSIGPSDICHWNGYPWPRLDPKRDTTPEQSLEGGQALHRVVGLMTKTRMLLLLGGEAQDATDAVLPELESSFPSLHIVRSLHPLGAKRTVDREEQRHLWADISTRLRQGRQAIEIRFVPV